MRGKKGSLVVPELREELEAILDKRKPVGLTKEQKALVREFYADFAKRRICSQMAQKLGISTDVLHRFVSRDRAENPDFWLDKGD